MSGYTTIPGGEDVPRTIPEVLRAARVRMAPGMWDLVAGGAETEATLRRNRDAMESLAFMPRILAGVAEPSLATTVLGQPVSSPLLMAPVGTIGHYHPDGPVAVAAAAARHGVLSVVGVLSSPALTEVAERAQGPLALQVYMRGDHAWLEDLVRRAEDAGYVAIMLSVDSTGAASREREIHNRFNRPYALSPNMPPGGARGLEHQVRLTWADLDRLRSITTLPLLVKGVINPLDAAEAIRHGVDGVYVSNHGGREMDHLPSTIEVLGEVVEAVRDAGGGEVIVDSGFLRGSDVVKALALGASAVGLGKLQVWSLVAGGVDGLVRTLEMLDHEMRHTLQLLGVADVRALGPEHLRPTTPTRRAPAELAGYTPPAVPST